MKDNEALIRERSYSGGKEHGPSFIEDQAELGYIRFGTDKKGKTNLSYSGCGAIAVWNALNVLFDRGAIDSIPSFSDVIYAFESRYTVRRGSWGSIPTAAASFFSNMVGLSVKLLYGDDPHKLTEFGTQGDVFISTFFNDRHDIRKMMHTVCIEKKDKAFVVHNGYCREKGAWAESRPCKTLAEAVSLVGEDNNKAIVTIGIRPGDRS